MKSYNSGNYVVLKYTTKQGKHCVTGSLRNIFSFMNIELNEFELFFLGEGFNIFYDKNEEGTGYLETQFNIESLRDNCGVEFEFTANTDFDTLEFNIRNNRPVIVQVNSAFLDYHPIFMSNKGRKHFIVAYGFDKDDSKFYISDSYILNNSYPTSYSGIINMEILRKAANACGNICYQIKKVAYRENTEVEWQKIIKKNLLRYLNCKPRDYHLPVGIFAMEQFYSNICLKLETLDDHLLLSYFRDVVYALKVLGFVTGRQFFKQILLKYNVCTPNDKIVNRINAINKNWSNLCLLFIKNALAKDRTRLSNNAEMFRNNMRQEKNILEDIIIERLNK